MIVIMYPNGLNGFFPGAMNGKAEPERPLSGGQRGRSSAGSKSTATYMYRRRENRGEKSSSFTKWHSHLHY